MLVAILCTGFTSAWGTTYKSYKGDTQQASTTISSANVSNGSVGVISWTGTGCTYSSSRVNIAANGSITFTASSGNIITKIVIQSGSSASYYGTWTSDPSVTPTSSSGTTTFDGINAISVTVTTSTAFRCTSASSISIYYSESGSGTETVATPTFSPAAGAYTSAQNVTISTTTSGATIYYTTNGNEPTINSSVYSSAIPVSTTTTIKAMAVKSEMDNSAVASATYTILGHAGTETDPYTVADARAAIDANSGVLSVYATGIVSNIVTDYNSQYGNISFDFVDSEGDTNTLRAYRCGGDEAANVQVGDVVVVSGNLTKYGSTYEFDEGCTLVSRTSSSTQVSADLSFSTSTANADLANLPAFTAPTLNNPHNLAITYTSSNTDVATVASDGQLNILAEGSTKITALSEETDEYLE